MSTRTSLIGIGRDHPRYKWVALSTTTLAPASQIRNPASCSSW
jgi:hypothetical protein